MTSARPASKLSSLTLALLLASLGCSAPAPSPEPTPTPAPRPEAAAGVDEAVVLVLGDSLAAGYGLPAEQAFPALVEEKLDAEGRPTRVVNAGVSGDTTAGGLRRIDWVLKANEPDVVVVELGGNDGLRGLSLEDTEANLRDIVERSQAAGARVLVAGMMIPPNYGPEYTEGFAALFPKVAEETGATLLPFLLEGMAGQPEYNLPDGIHPNAQGHRIIAATLTEALRPLLEDP